MIRTLYRRPDASTAPAAAFDPIPATDPLFGAVPSWRFEDDPPGWLETVAELGDPTAVQVDVVVEDLPAPLPVDEVPTRALVLVRRCYCRPNPCSCDEPDGQTILVDRVLPGDVVDDLQPPEQCPDCSATGLDPCRPKGDPVTGRPLTRWHRRRRALVEHRDTGSAATSALLRIGLAIACAVLAVLAFGQAGSGNERGIVVPSSRVPSPCPAGTAPGCPDGPRP